MALVKHSHSVRFPTVRAGHNIIIETVSSCHVDHIFQSRARFENVSIGHNIVYVLNRGDKIPSVCYFTRYFFPLTFQH